MSEIDEVRREVHGIAGLDSLRMRHYSVARTAFERGASRAGPVSRRHAT
ncbi:MAG: hypothetical protein INH06_19850 [Cupriavidus sp.]|nr:hypothetical protein [Cupriavidus sp.]MCA3234536.1 hypothetical protein [Cupriavidus sp.]